MDESCGNRSIFSDWRNDPDCFTLWVLVTSKERRDDLFAVSIWCVMICVALVTNVLILVGIGSSATMRSATCYWLVISLAFCDIGMVTIGIVHLVPATTFRTRFVETFGWRNIIMLFFYDVFYYTGVLLLGFMASNRFVSIVYPMEYTRIFSRGRSLAYIIFGTFFGFLVSLPALFPCCHTIWDGSIYIAYYENSDTCFKYVDLSVNSLTLLLMIVSYMVIIFKVRQSGRAMTNNQLTIRTRSTLARKQRTNEHL
ncbi:hypothetical protein PENTCL1PPCAC_27953 [Pristionchus entomophagus]|uniref:G-protein coupled receptors family 1 profile domain-containing protein n=1 Tax=Pristionchus entomophagus TaxID=358040 RepID=A0AAV5UFR5_9BILA|nr:hypothetical protein PENTCL1PPCAC_27953 [Pristionchus entomophagus]